MPLYFSRFRELPHHVFVNTLKLLKITHEHKVSLSRFNGEKCLTILPNGFPVSEFKVSGSPLPVSSFRTIKKSIWEFYSPFTPSLRDLRVLLGIMHLAITLSHKNDLDESGVVLTTLSEVRNAAAIRSNLDDIKSSIRNLSQISLNTGDEWRFLIECEQLLQPFRLSQLVIVLHPILVKSIHTFLKKNYFFNTTSYSIYYINDLVKLSKGVGAKSAQALYIYYSSTLSQGMKSYNHFRDTLCRKIYQIDGTLAGGNRRSLTQGIWRLTEIGWLVTMPSKNLFIVNRPPRHSVPQAKTDKIKSKSKPSSRSKRDNRNTHSTINNYRKRYPITRAEA